ncbi:MAG TPA: hypothetical protein VFV07_13650 [Rhizomicrobium sp.]|nr:hypothetical protein [Rhizomicrobium sp.]
MHPPRIPLDFDFSYAGFARFHVASGDTGVFWIGVLLVLGTAWNLWSGFRGGDFGASGFLGQAGRGHPTAYWSAAAIHSILLLGGLDFVVSGLIGIKPFSMP